MGKFERFIESRRLKQTGIAYRHGMRALLGDAPSFLRLAEIDKRKAEDHLIDRVIKCRDKVAGSTIRTNLSQTKALLSFYDVALNWARVKQVAPRGAYIAADRAPSKEEIRTLLKECRPRGGQPSW